MKELSNQTVETLAKVLPILIDNIDTKNKSNKLINAVRIARKISKQLNKTNQNGRSSEI